MVEIRWAHGALAMWTIEVERGQRIQAIHDRENEECMKRYGEPYFSVLRPKKSLPWGNTPEFAKAREEELQVQHWFMDALKKQKEESEGGDASTAAELLGEMRQKALVDVSAVGRALQRVENEIAYRKGEGVQAQKETEDERKRFDLRVVPYRTEYEAKTGEVVAATYQVYKGANPYSVTAHAPETFEGPRAFDFPQSGDLVVPFTFRKAGDYSPTIRVIDAHGDSKSATISIKVTGSPVPPGTKKTDPGQLPPKSPSPTATPTPSPRGNAPVPLVGTFNALFWRANAELNRWDVFGQPGGIMTPVPLTITLDASGTLSGVGEL